MEITIGRTGRNDPCPCGSGKKYKKCCMLIDHDFYYDENMIRDITNIRGLMTPR